MLPSKLDGFPASIEVIKVAGKDRSVKKQKMTQPGCTKMAIFELLLRLAGSNLVGKSKWYFIIKFGLLLSIILC